MFLSVEHANEVACRAAIVTIRLSAVIADRYQRRTATDGSAYFVLCSVDDEELGSSTHYDDPEACDYAIEVMRADAAGAQVVHVPSAGPGLDGIKLTRRSGFVVVAPDDFAQSVDPPPAPEIETAIEAPESTTVETEPDT